MPRKQPFNALLADAFRAAQAEIRAGWPSCPHCHDGKDVRHEAPSSVGDPEIRRYRCMCCVRRFSDLTLTPLAGTRSPLRVWALVLLTWSGEASQRALAVLTGVERHHLRAMAGLLKGSLTATRWSAELRAAGLTAISLIASYPVERQQAFHALATSLKSRCQPKRAKV